MEENKRIHTAKEEWDAYSDEYFAENASEEIVGRIIEDPSWAFPAPVWDMILSSYPNLRGKNVLVPSSGDNAAVFAFHLLGAAVTSADISERQLENARRIAAVHGWDIRFVCDDSMSLAKIEDGMYDLVYTSNGVHVWIPDLLSMYRSFHRVLNKDGQHIMYEVHPVIRPFGDDEVPLITVRKPYENIHFTDNVPKFAWRIQDIFNAAFDAGFKITHMEEFHPGKNDNDLWFYKNQAHAEADNYMKFDWKQNPWAVLPQWIGFSARKYGGNI